MMMKTGESSKLVILSRFLKLWQTPKEPKPGYLVKWEKPMSMMMMAKVDWILYWMELLCNWHKTRKRTSNIETSTLYFKGIVIVCTLFNSLVPKIYWQGQVETIKKNYIHTYIFHQHHNQTSSTFKKIWCDTKPNLISNTSFLLTFWKEANCLGRTVRVHVAPVGAVHMGQRDTYVFFIFSSFVLRSESFSFVNRRPKQKLLTTTQYAFIWSIATFQKGRGTLLPPKKNK